MKFQAKSGALNALAKTINDAIQYVQKVSRI